MSTTRRSKRITAAGTTTGIQTNLTQAQPNDDVVRPAKRRKVTSVTPKESKAAVQRRNGKGKLRNLPLMPLDILFEIFGYLLPLELLRLARTSKDFRTVLMKRSASSLWKTAFENIPEAPVKPQGVSEPSWANFLFTTTCYECLVPRAKHAFGGHQVRYCNRCVMERVYFDPTQYPRLCEDLRSLGLAIETPGLAYRYQISLSGRYGYKTTWLRSDIEDFKNGYAMTADKRTLF
ncbi:hypothetical protein ONZ45_g17939 [Pleurotus djamor]|nr:hypothetical protein ONZ45_g17939 [Pleurotus djamor]